ncbi:MAG: class I SAM-dependent methyltransferase [Boseongicola sp.]|nr:MAG: class I SAM-dependent methyltransferase [Boseongicola sp.]
MIDLLAKRAYVACIRVVRTLLKPTGLLDRLEKSENRRARWFRSLFAIYDLDDMERLGVPWWTYDAIDAVSKFLIQNPGARVFEWGSGASTLWLAKRSGEVISAEFDANWHQNLAAKLQNAGHVTVKLTPALETGEIASRKRGFEGQYFDDFVRAIRSAEGEFDVIVIDGRSREACLTEAVGRLKADGIIVFDDTKRQRYKDAISDCGLPFRRFDGLAVSLPISDSTTLIARSEETLSAF